MSRVGRWCALVTAAAVSAAAPPASASTASVEPGSPWGNHTFLFDGGAGERNDVTVEFRGLSRTGHTAVRVADAGAAIQPGAGCRSLAPHVVQCSLPREVPSGYPVYFDRHLVNAGDGDDVVRLSAMVGADSPRGVVADGGPGADTIHALVSGEILGGEGPDRLTGPDASGRLDGGPGADLMFGGDDGDTMVGGAGPDDMRGGGGDDRLYGDGASLYAEGAPLDVHPAGAQDALEGGDGDDLLEGGPGADSIACGPGRDSNVVAVRRDLVPITCETVAFVVDYEWGIWFRLPSRPFRWAGDSPSFRVPCGELTEPWGYEVAAPCRGSMTLREADPPGRLLGVGAVPRQVGTVRLNALGRLLTQRRYGVRATVTVRGNDIGPPNGWTIRLRRP